MSGIHGDRRADQFVWQRMVEPETAPRESWQDIDQIMVYFCHETAIDAAAVLIPKKVGNGLQFKKRP